MYDTLIIIIRRIIIIIIIIIINIKEVDYLVTFLS
jgi:hypothetical protein